jgi:hypothetical protein
MDVSLLAASLGLAVYLPRKRELYPVKIALCLSLCLISLSVLETLPVTWLLVLTKDDSDKKPWNQGGLLTITSAYRFLLWQLSLYVLLVLPGVAGTQIVGRVLYRIQGATASVDADEQKKRQFDAQRNTALWARLGFKLAAILWRTMQLVMVSPLLALLRRVYPSFHQSRSDAYILVMTQKDCSPNSTPTASHQGSTNMNRLAWFLGSSLYRQSLLVGSILGVATTLITLGLIAPLVFHTTTDKTSTLLEAVTWLCAVGILLSALLNGFGSVSMPHSCLAGLYLTPFHPDAIVQAESELQKAEESLNERRIDLKSGGLHLQSGQLIGTRRQTVPSVQSFSDMGGDNLTHQRQKNLQTEVEFLENLVGEMTEDVAEMRHSQTIAANARTTVGRIRSWMGVVFSIVLLVRLMTAAIGLCTHPGDRSSSMDSRPTRGDPITTALLWLTGKHVVTLEYYDSLSQFVSLVLTAFLSFSQVRTFLKTANAVNRRLDHFFHVCYCNNGKNKVDTLNDELLFAIKLRTHILASLMGCYFLSCIVLTKMMLPEEYRVSFSAALGGTDAFQVRTNTVNGVFALSAIVSVCILGMLLGIQSQNTHRYTNTDERTLTQTLDP